MKSQAQAKFQRGKETAQNAAQSANQQEGSAGGMAQNLKEQAKQTANQNVSEEDKQKAQDTKEARKQQAQAYLKEKMPKERREQTIWRLKKMIVEVQGHQDCKFTNIVSYPLLLTILRPASY